MKGSVSAIVLVAIVAVAIGIFVTSNLDFTTSSATEVTGLAAKTGCILRNPSISVKSPTAVPAGDAARYSVTIKNNNKNCPVATFYVEGFVGAYGFAKIKQAVKYSDYKIYALNGTGDGDVGLNLMQVAKGKEIYLDSVVTKELQRSAFPKSTLSIFPLDINERPAGSGNFYNTLIFVNDDKFDVTFRLSLSDLERKEHRSLSLPSDKSTTFEMKVYTPQGVIGKYIIPVAVYNIENTEAYSYAQTSIQVK